MNLREAARALVVDDDGCVLLVRFEFPGRTVWATPGGGLEPGEQPLDGLRRELTEELGLTDVDIGPQVWERTHVIPMTTGHDGQRDRIFLVRTPRFEPAPAIGWEQLRAEYVHEMRWWSVDEIATVDAPHTHFAPSRLAELLPPLLAGELPEFPLDTGV